MVTKAALNATTLQVSKYTLSTLLEILNVFSIHLFCSHHKKMLRDHTQIIYMMPVIIKGLISVIKQLMAIDSEGKKKTSKFSIVPLDTTIWLS